MPEEEQAWFPKDEVLSYEEMLRVIRVGAGLGIRKVRVTGGEPLTRPGVADFCASINEIAGIEEIGISTNGTLLSKQENGVSMAARLVKAGVRSANVSLDSLDGGTYQRSTGRDLLPKVMEGIDAAIDAGFRSIRLNCVLMKNQTEREFVPLMNYAWEKGLLLRFIELMPVSTQEVLKEDHFLATGLARQLIEQHTGPLVPLPNFKTNGPAMYYAVPGTEQKIGFIGAMTNLHFCESCNKLRLTSDGKLRPCLGSWLEFDLRSVLRSGCTDAELADFIHHVVARKPKEHDFRDNYQPNRRMIAIGG
ncbi:cyclic pyranopterin phosphate synthase [Prosthecobacter fusiformis]|uniref:Cyclic pyranopterin phosphate synthase n=2 Tax=Prosthecobacter fusiformis TaxID=48464 RepID=A0A4R7SQJ8_9BACT|nr:cyclic pyranopterin phosphate synthase [Prosthecobacter fusiformis]